MVVFILFLFLNVFSQTYYVETTGFDDILCGSQNFPCASINQVVFNNPGASYTVSVGDGSFTTLNIILLGYSDVNFQGTGSTIINASWRSFGFIINSEQSKFEFRDVTLSLSGDGTDFTTLETENNAAGFYNVVLIFPEFFYGDFIDINGGSVIFNNFTFEGSTYNAYLISDVSSQSSTNITVSSSTFSNLYFQLYGGLIVFEAHFTASVLVDRSIFTNITTDDAFTAFWVDDPNQQFRITNSLFSNASTGIPCVYFEISKGGTVFIQNINWNNTFTLFVSGALEILGSDDGIDHDILLDQITVVNSSGPYAGGVFIAYNTLILSNSTFVGNYGQRGNDVVQGLDDRTDSFKYLITNSYSSSKLPKAAVWDVSTDALIDISDQLPNPSSDGLENPLSLPLPSVRHARTIFAARKPQLRKKRKRNKK